MPRYRVRLVALVEIFDDPDGRARRVVHELTDARTRALNTGPRESAYLAPESELMRINRALGDVYERAPDPDKSLI